MFAKSMVTICTLFLASSQWASTQKLNVLIVGNGGREHALAHKVAQSNMVDRIIVAPGNGGTASMSGVRNVPIKATDIEALMNLAQQEKIDLAIIGPEAPLAAGIVDAFQQHKIACLGPTQKAAQIETSKAFAKEFMQRHQIPTASYEVITSLAQAEAYINAQDTPLVVKADGLASGKGVIIAHTKQEARDAAHDMLSGASFGNAGKKIVIEQFLTGQEVSFIVLTDGVHALPLATAQDYKKLNDGDLGPNTGGMGAYSPAPCITPELHTRLMKDIIEPTIKHLAEDGMPFVGFLYAGLMISPSGEPYVLEFNCRLGDPETQVILPRMQTDLVPLVLAAVNKQLHTMHIEWDPRPAVTVVVADEGYPTPTHLRQPITINPTNNSMIFHAGTTWNNMQLVSSGGRILTVTALAGSFDLARKKVYENIQHIQMGHMRYRRDIALNL